MLQGHEGIVTYAYSQVALRVFFSFLREGTLPQEEFHPAEVASAGAAVADQDNFLKIFRHARHLGST